MKPSGLYRIAQAAISAGAVCTLIFSASALFAAQANPAVVDEKSADSGDADEMLEEKGATFEFHGQYKNLFVYQQVKQYYGELLFPHGGRNLYTDLNRIRFSPEFRYADNIVVHVDYDNEVFFSNFNKSYEFDNYWRPSGYNDLIQMKWDILYNRNVYYRMKIHRAYAKFIYGNLTLTLGRQQIRFGSGKLWNPLDILNPISPTFIEGPEEQPGTDAVKIDYFFNATTELSLVYDQKRFDDSIKKINPKNSNSVMRFKTAVMDVEVALLAGYISRRTVGGADVSVTLFDGILRGSAVYSHPEKGRAYVQANAGYEYTFRNGIYFLLEYFYNQNGMNYNLEQKITVIESALYGINQHNYFRLANQFLTFNQHYSGLALGYDFHPLVRGDFFTIYDFQGQGIFCVLSLKYSVIENLDFTAGAMMSYLFGMKESSDFAALHRQFMYYGSLQYFF